MSSKAEEKNKTRPASPIIANGLGIRFRNYGYKRPTIKQRIVSRARNGAQYFWALKDINFEVKPGDVFFIIGRNGAGKTTLLRILANTLRPDTGKLEVNGEINAFLSMGLGFRPELSGIDNIQLSLTFMDFSQEKIKELMPEIKNFCKLGKYLQAPVKYYSAGMRARLAFAVATSVDPDILIMDEVINAGDEEFREKCQQRVKQLMENAKATVISTHNLKQALQMATKLMWIEKGVLQFIGEPQEGVKLYRDFITKVRNDPFYDLEKRLPNGVV